MKFYCSGLYGGGDYYVSPEEGLRNNLLLHSGPIFSAMGFHGLSESHQVVVICNCTFGEVTAVKNSISSDKLAFLCFLHIDVYLSLCKFNGIEYNDGPKDVIDCSFSNLTIMDIAASGIKGDFMRIEQCSVLLAYSYFTNNRGLSLISVCNGKLIVENSQFKNNTCEDAAIIHLIDTEARLMNCILTGNRDGHVGAIMLYKSEAHVINSTLTGNKGKYTGGIDLYNSEIHVKNCTLTGNKGKYTGGIDLYNSKAYAIYSTLTGNKGRRAGGIVLYNSEAHMISRHSLETKVNLLVLPGYFGILESQQKGVIFWKI